MADEATRRLRPRLGDPSFLVLRSCRRLLSTWLAAVSDGAIVLDVGSGDGPYRDLLRGRESTYLSFDLSTRRRPSAAADMVALPLRAECADLAICTQAIEYVSDPRACVAELHRVLRPGAVVLLTAPAAWPRDDDLDAWRFLEAGLRSLFSSFATVEVVAEIGTIETGFRTVAKVLEMSAAHAGRSASLAVRPLIAICNLLGLAGRRLSANSDFAANYAVRAT